MDEDDRIDDETIPKKAVEVQQASDEFTVEEVKRWIAEARELAIYETEKRMRAEFEKEKSQELRIRNQDAGGENGDVVGVKNTDFSLPAGGGVVGDNTNNGGVIISDANGQPVKKKRTYTMITAKHRSKRHFDYVKMR